MRCRHDVRRRSRAPRPGLLDRRRDLADPADPHPVDRHDHVARLQLAIGGRPVGDAEHLGQQRQLVAELLQRHRDRGVLRADHLHAALALHVGHGLVRRVDHVARVDTPSCRRTTRRGRRRGTAWCVALVIETVVSRRSPFVGYVLAPETSMVGLPPDTASMSTVGPGLKITYGTGSRNAAPTSTPSSTVTTTLVRVRRLMPPPSQIAATRRSVGSAAAGRAAAGTGVRRCRCSGRARRGRPAGAGPQRGAPWRSPGRTARRRPPTTARSARAGGGPPRRPTASQPR